MNDTESEDMAKGIRKAMSVGKAEADAIYTVDRLSQSPKGGQNQNLNVSKEPKPVGVKKQKGVRVHGAD